MSENLPVLQIVVPLLLAPVAALVRRPRLSWLVALTAALWAFAVAVTLLTRVLADGAISYHMGAWAPPWGIEYRVDELNAFVLVIVAAIAAVVMPYARTSVEREVAPDRIPLFYTALILCMTG
ncbi:MAG TPA: hypothetical protein VJ997_05840, partial [Longimicrobiales bacterium]|nr:hypothetical protein [Longimicrobiales bacterium]